MNIRLLLMYRLVHSYSKHPKSSASIFSKYYRSQLLSDVKQISEKIRTPIGRCSLHYTIQTLALVDGSNGYIAGYHRTHFSSKLTGNKRRHILL